MLMPRQPKRATAEMLPLMDMIFLLLVLFIFMIVQMRPDFGISVELPQIGEQEMSAPEETEEELSTVTVSVLEDGNLYVNETITELDNLPANVMQAAAAAAPESVSVILRGDRRADYGIMIDLFNRLQKQGLNKIVFDVETSIDTNENQ